MNVLRNLGFGFYLLLNRWKGDGDRRLAVSASLATSFVINLVSLRYLLDSILGSFSVAYDPDVSNFVLVIVLAAVWLVASRLIITDQIYSEIKIRSAIDSECTEARSFAVRYLWATILLFVVALVLATAF